MSYADTIPAAEHSRTCAMFSSGHDQDGRFRPVPCDCHVSGGGAS